MRIPTTTWKRFVAILLGTFAGAAALLYVFILLVDPYDDVPFSLPLQRAIVSAAQRHMYPQIARSRRFDSLIVGTSTSRLIDPTLLDAPLHAHFANLAMNSMSAFEQKTMIGYFEQHAGPIKTLV